MQSRPDSGSTTAHDGQPIGTIVDVPQWPSEQLTPQRPIASAQSAEDGLPRVHLRKAGFDEVPVDRPTPGPARATSLGYIGGAADSPLDLQRSEVDLEVLAVKIRSINLSLTAIESELLEQQEWSVDRLEAALDDLSRLIDKASLVRTYYMAITEAQRELIEPPLDVGPLKASLAQRAFETRIRLTGVNRERIDPADDRPQRLERISEVLQQWKID
jgi:hypothetical protein